MKFTPFELGIANMAMKTTEQVGQDGRPFARYLSVSQQEDGVAILKKMRTCVDGVIFVEGDIDFSTTEKALLLEFLNRPWGVDDTEHVLTLKEKLK